MRIGDERIRLENIDAPELPGAGPHCNDEVLLATASRDELRRMVDGARRIEVIRHGKDRYGRTLGRLVIDGQDAGEQLVFQGLAVPWEGHKHGAAWCTEDWDPP